MHQGCHALALLASVLGPARAVSAHMVSAGRPPRSTTSRGAPFGYGLTAGENLTCLYELEGGVYVVNEEHYRPEVDSSTIRFEVVGTEGALALDHAVPLHLYRSASPHWHPGRQWQEVPLTDAERRLGGRDSRTKRCGGWTSGWPRSGCRPWTRGGSR